MKINILICGEYSAITLKLISRLKQERHEIFMITGRTNKIEARVRGVFQEYNFTYTSAGVVNIIQNIYPEMVIYMGALDEHFSWDNEKQQSVEYISGLTNILIASFNANVKRFIYCSSAEVYEDNIESHITKETVPSPIEIRMKTYLQGEDTCKYYHKSGSFEIAVIRFCEIYGSFSKRNVHRTICYDMVDEMIQKGSVPVRAEKQHNLMYIDDAVEALYRVVNKNADSFNIYHVLGSTYTEQQIAESISRVKGNITIREIPYQDVVKRKELVAAVLGVVENFSEKYTLDTGMEKYIAQAVTEKRTAELREKPKKFVTGNRFVAMFETAVLVMLGWFLTEITAGTVLGESIDFYLLTVVIISVVHGSFLGILAVILSVVAKFGTIISGQGIIRLVTNYGQYLWMLQILIVGVLVSFVRDILKRKTIELREDNEYIKKELENINKINESNVYVKNIYEKRLVNYKNSLAKIYEITSRLDYLSVQKVIFEAVEVVREVIQSREVSIYMAGDNSKYLRLMASTSEKAAKMGKSICIEAGNPIYDGIMEEGYFRNKHLKEDLPMLAANVASGEQVKSIIMVWSLDIEGANLYQANLLAVLCKLIEKSMRQAQTYMDAISDNILIEGSRALRVDAFQQILEMYQEGRIKKLLDFSLLEVFQQGIPLPELLKKAEKGIRVSDYLGLTMDEKVYILLTNSMKNDLKLIIDRFEKSGVTCRVVEAY